MAPSPVAPKRFADRLLAGVSHFVVWMMWAILVSVVAFVLYLLVRSS